MLTETSKTQLTALLTVLERPIPTLAEALASAAKGLPTEQATSLRQLITSGWGGGDKSAEVAAVAALAADVAAN